MRLSALKNYHVFEPVIEKDGEGVTTEKWGVNVYNQSIDEPDYRIISMKEYNRHYLYELEKIIK